MAQSLDDQIARPLFPARKIVHMSMVTFAFLLPFLTRLEAAGFTIARITYTNSTLFLPLLVARMIQRRRGLRDATDADHEIAVPPEPINSSLSVVMWAESLWLRVFNAPFGSSLLCLARKPSDSL